MVAGGAVATAAPKAKPACNALSDAAGDATGFILTDPGVTPNTKTLDILSGDLGANAKTITAVLRLSDMTTTDSSAPTGRNYVVLFTSGEKELYLAAVLDGSGNPTFTAGWVSTRRTFLSGATGVVDVAKKEIRISAPLSAFAAEAALKPGMMLTDLNAYSQRFIGANGTGVTPTSDVAEGGKGYAIASASCVVPGK
jgi:hypothetical protein